MVELDLPSGLRKQLEDDYFKIKRNNKVKVATYNSLEWYDSFLNSMECIIWYVTWISIFTSASQTSVWAKCYWDFGKFR